jgi:hypothetical protein
MRTPSIKKAVARKAVKTTAKHTVHGTASKLRRDPVRTATPLAVGTLAGAAVSWLLTHGGSRGEP